MKADVPSPFHEGVQFAWDSTSLGWLKECPRKYYYSMVRGLRAKGENINLEFGLLYHEGLEHFDKGKTLGLSHEDALDDTIQYLLARTWRDGAPWKSDHASKTRETLIRSVIWYCDHFKDDPAKTVILQNGKPAIELSFKMELDWGHQDQPYLLCGHIDRLVEFFGGYYAMDRKTSSSTLASNYFDQYDPDNQMSLYTLVSSVIYKTPVKGVIIDAAQIAVGFTRFARGFTYRTEAQINEWLKDLHYWFDLAYQYSKKDYWPMNDKSCHKYGGCPFRRLCGKSPEVREKFIETDYVVHKWNPLEPR
jgi:hypothetical protein